MTTPTPYPLVFQPVLKPKVWGGRRLEGWGKRLPMEQDGLATFGESWELADLGATSASGAGGQPAHSVIANGPLAGRTIRDAIALWGDALIDLDRLTPQGGFPLLLKYLDAREHLSVQNHPSPAYAATHPDAHLKTESWVVLEADPGSLIYLGVRDGVTTDDLERALRAGTLPELMHAVSPVVGACYTLPSGCIHALGAGVLVAEVQTPSDTTYRLYDWTREYNRPERELHTRQALESCTLEPVPAPVNPEQPRANLAATEHYTIDRWNGSCEAVRYPDGAPIALMLTRTQGCELVSASGSFEDVPAGRAQTVLIPASIAGDTTLRAGPATETLVISLP
ncbi:MAG: class I mannose-6-phosphate isomerase [Phycisphaerales bacterium JB040]